MFFFPQISDADRCPCSCIVFKILYMYLTFTCICKYIYILYIYLEPDPCFGWKRPWGWPSKIEVIGVPGIYIYHIAIGSVDVSTLPIPVLVSNLLQRCLSQISTVEKVTATDPMRNTTRTTQILAVRWWGKDLVAISVMFFEAERSWHVSFWRNAVCLCDLWCYNITFTYHHYQYIMLTTSGDGIHVMNGIWASSDATQTSSQYDFIRHSFVWDGKAPPRNCQNWRFKRILPNTSPQFRLSTLHESITATASENGGFSSPQGWTNVIFFCPTLGKCWEYQTLRIWGARCVFS